MIEVTDDVRLMLKLGEDKSEVMNSKLRYWIKTRVRVKIEWVAMK